MSKLMAAAPDPDDLRRLLTVEEVAQVLNTSVRSVWKMNCKGTMPEVVRMMGTKWNRYEIEEWVDDGCPSLENDRRRYRRRRAS